MFPPPLLRLARELPVLSLFEPDGQGDGAKEYGGEKGHGVVLTIMPLVMCKVMKVDGRAVRTVMSPVFPTVLELVMPVRPDPLPNSVPMTATVPELLRLIPVSCPGDVSIV